MNRDFWHIEDDPVSGELRERGSGPPEADIKQLDECVLLQPRGNDLLERAGALDERAEPFVAQRSSSAS